MMLRLNEEFLPAARERGIKIELDCPRPAIVKTDAALLERILTNLVANAISNNEDCTVHLSAKSRETGFLLTVSDNGVGIPLEEQGKIFSEALYSLKR